MNSKLEYFYVKKYHLAINGIQDDERISATRSSLQFRGNYISSQKMLLQGQKNFKLTCFSTYSFPWLAICAPYPTATLAMGPCRNSLPANCPNGAENPGMSCLFSILVSSNNGVGPVDPP